MDWNIFKSGRIDLFSGKGEMVDMGIFDKLKKSKKQLEITGMDVIDKSDWLKVFSSCLGKMMAIQNHAGKCVGKGQNWNVDFTTGTIAFGEDRFPIQLIGTESNTSHTWMWGWNNVNHLPEDLIALPKEMLNKGEEWNLDPLRLSKFELNDIFNGHNMSVAACGLSDQNYFYYRAPHKDGAIFLAVSNATEEVFAPVDMDEFINLTVECAQQFLPLHHKIFVESFLQWNQVEFDFEKDRIIAHFQQDLHIIFEQSSGEYRIDSLSVV